MEPNVSSPHEDSDLLNRKQVAILERRVAVTEIAALSSLMPLRRRLAFIAIEIRSFTSRRTHRGTSR